MLLALVLLACPPLPKPAVSLKGLTDVTKQRCAKGATKQEARERGDESRTRERTVVVREKGPVREIAFTDRHHWVGLGDSSGTDVERVVFVQVDGGTVSVEASVEHNPEMGPATFERVSCRLDERGPTCRAVDKGRAADGSPGPERVTCGPEADARLPTLEGVQRRYELCPELLAR